MIKLIIPLSAPNPTKKKPLRKWWLNLNNYRNAHRMVLYTVKEFFTQRFCAGIMPFYCLLPPYRFTYTLYWKDRRRVDMMNVGSIVDKFVSDALVESGFIPDDSTKEIRDVHFIYGGIDKKFPRMELIVESL